MKDYYQVLGISKSATDEQIKKAFRKKAMESHPDQNKGDIRAEERFKEVNEAYAVLRDRKKRKQYDLFGSKGFHEKFSRDDIFQDFDINDILNSFGMNQGRQGTQGFRGGQFQNVGGNFGNIDQFMDPFKNLFRQGGHGNTSSAKTSRGGDILQKLHISFKESILGGESLINITRNGNKEKTNLKIPPGITEGQKLRLVGKGYRSPVGGPNGDLLLEIHISPHPLFYRDGNDIIISKEILLSEAILGTIIQVPTLSGDKNVKVPPGTQYQAKLRLKGLGIPNKGDQLIQIFFKTPKDLDEKQKSLVEKIKNAGL